MDGDDSRQAIQSLLLILGSVFFVAAEYGMVSARKSRIENLAKRGSLTAKRLAKDLEDLSPYVATNQIAITMIGIGVGSVTEPFVTALINQAIGGWIGATASFLVSFFIVTFVLVVVGELVPKYYALRFPERVALFAYRPLWLFRRILTPLVWLAQTSAALVLRPLGMNLSTESNGGIPKEELLLLVQSGGAEGTLDKMHAELVSRALRLDVLDARDIMVHRLDIKWLDLELSPQEVRQRVRHIPYTRIPVCRGDIDEVVGLAYLHDIFKGLDRPDFSLAKIMREPIVIPENLSVERIVATMREQKTQVLLVVDEYGGTSGLVTLEDVVEEIFGEFEDKLESERPPIEVLSGGRVSARAEVRFDELVSFLALPIDEDQTTDALAQIVVDSLERVPRVGDSIETEIGTIRVENMALRRITRVSIQLRDDLQRVLPDAT